LISFHTNYHVSSYGLFAIPTFNVWGNVLEKNIPKPVLLLESNARSRWQLRLPAAEPEFKR